MFKIDVLGTSQGRHYVDVALGRNKDALGRLSESFETLDKLSCFCFLVIC